MQAACSLTRGRFSDMKFLANLKVLNLSGNIAQMKTEKNKPTKKSTVTGYSVWNLPKDAVKAKCLFSFYFKGVASMLYVFRSPALHQALTFPRLLLFKKTLMKLSLLKKCPYLELFWSVLSSIQARIQSECGKVRTRITPNTGTFRAVYKKSIWL